MELFVCPSPVDCGSLWKSGLSVLLTQGLDKADLHFASPQEGELVPYQAGVTF